MAIDPPRPTPPSWTALFEAVDQLHRRACGAADGLRTSDYPVADAFASARNFAAYGSLRRTDMRELQRELHRTGLSSLGRIESHALDSLARVRAILALMIGNPTEHHTSGAIDYDEGEQVLARRTAELLGPRPAAHTPRIMVTMPTEASECYELVRDLVDAGMQVARINCAHDDPATWAAMAGHVQRAVAALERPCRVHCDLPGPKLRTGSV